MMSEEGTSNNNNNVVSSSMSNFMVIEKGIMNAIKEMEIIRMNSITLSESGDSLSSCSNAAIALVTSTPNKSTKIDANNNNNNRNDDGVGETRRKLLNRAVSSSSISSATINNNNQSSIKNNNQAILLQSRELENEISYSLAKLRHELNDARSSELATIEKLERAERELRQMKDNVIKIKKQAEDEIKKLFTPRPWMPDDSSDFCLRCHSAFSFINRRHHCRCCGDLVDGKCSNHFVSIPRYGFSDPVRICDKCFKEFSNGGEVARSLIFNNLKIQIEEDEPIGNSSSSTTKTESKSYLKELDIKTTLSSNENNKEEEKNNKGLMNAALLDIKNRDSLKKEQSQQVTSSSKNDSVIKSHPSFLSDIKSGIGATKLKKCKSICETPSPHKLKENINYQLRSGILKRRSAIVGSTPDSTISSNRKTHKKSALAASTIAATTIDEQLELAKKKKAKENEANLVNKMIPKQGSIARFFSRMSSNNPKSNTTESSFDSSAEWSFL